MNRGQIANLGNYVLLETFKIDSLLQFHALTHPTQLSIYPQIPQKKSSSFSLPLFSTAPHYFSINGWQQQIVKDCT